MRGHGQVGQKFAGQVTQVVSGAIGLDDWEWAVDLHADDPLVFKKLVTAMRYDGASARFADFGAFVIGLRQDPEALGRLLLA
jgi:peroxiredoxin